MAVLEKIRNRAGVLIAIFVGVALVLFIIDPQVLDFISFKNRQQAGEINNKVITWDKFNTLVEERSSIMGANTPEMIQQVRESVWQELVREKLLEDEYDALGIMVTEDEINELTTGKDPHSFVKQQLRDPRTGQFSRTFLFNILEQVDKNPEIRVFWNYLKKQLVKIRKYEKFNTLASKGLYATTLEAKQMQENQSKMIDFSYIVSRYSEISDSAIEVTDADIEKYYQEHKKEFKQKASRDIEYVIFRLDPSEEDTKKVLENITNVRKEFAKADSGRVQRLIRLESDQMYEDIYYKNGKLSPVINDTMFAAKDTGLVVGPYFEKEAYKLSKLIEIAYGSDSARARHILIRPQGQTYEDLEEARKRIDSIKNAIEEGANFEEMAIQFSEDPGSKENGGDLGWFSEGQMVKPVQDAAFYNEKGSLQVVSSQFGVHLIEVLERGELSKRVKVATIVKRVEPSGETINKVLTNASDFAYNNKTLEEFRESANNDPSVQLKTANNLNKSSSYIPGIPSPKPLLAWVYDAEKNEISKNPISIKDEMYVVAAVTEIREKGIAPLEQVKTRIEPEVIKEKKGELLKSRMQSKSQGMQDMESIADKLGLTVDEAMNVNFMKSSLEIGPEPRVIGYAHAFSKEKISEPIIGENGVFIIKVNRIKEPPENIDISLAKDQLQKRYSSSAYYFYQSILEDADIEDNRLTLYR